MMRIYTRIIHGYLNICYFGVKCLLVSRVDEHEIKRKDKSQKKEVNQEDLDESREEKESQFTKI